MSIALPHLEDATVGVLVGPGVLSHLDGLHGLAGRIGVAVINTWGAKGVFRWDAPHHGGTTGLQARDFELAGLGEVDVLVTSGLDPDEVTSTPWAGRAEILDVAPSELGVLADRWPLPPAEPVRPRLYSELAAVVGPMYDDPSTPPGRIRALSALLAPGSAVFAPPGLAGFWVARTWPTTEPGSVVVPARAEPGETERRAAESARAGRPTTLVTDSPSSVAARSGVNVVVWDDLDLSVPASILDVAGPVVAWT